VHLCAAVWSVAARRAQGHSGVPWDRHSTAAGVRHDVHDVHDVLQALQTVVRHDEPGGRHLQNRQQDRAQVEQAAISRSPTMMDRPAHGQLHACPDPTRVCARCRRRVPLPWGGACILKHVAPKRSAAFKQSHNKPTQTNKQHDRPRGQRWSRLLSCQRCGGMAWHGMAWHGMAHGMAWHGCQRPAMLRRTNKRGRNWAGQLVVKDTVEGSGADNEATRGVSLPRAHSVRARAGE
jgi:hypothetical protein